MLGLTIPARRSFSLTWKLSVFACALVLASSAARAAIPADPAKRAAVVGKPAALQVQPAALTLTGPRAMQQIVVTARYADGEVRDVTPFCDFSVEGQDAAQVTTDGFVLPRKNGSTTLVARAGGQVAKVPLTIKNFDKPQPYSFRHDMIAAMNVGGCNMGACHGTPSGKNGFRLSLRGYDPAADYLQLTRDVLGRRTDRLDPMASLIMQKPLGRVPHEGGQRFTASSLPAQVFKGWIAEGLRDDPPNLPELKSLEVLPTGRVLRQPARWQQLAVIAHFADGSARD
ncbi:MAG: hypothetical protein E6K70_23565, partial [Planctomycetota bacterium]